MKKVLVINGPNLNMLGLREPNIYGSQTLADIEKGLQAKAQALGLLCECFQSNHEGELIERIHQARQQYHFIIINAGAYTHTSIAIRDALSAVEVPFIEVHLSNVHARESFRHHSYLSDLARAVICGLGVHGYYAALEYVSQSS